MEENIDGSNVELPKKSPEGLEDFNPLSQISRDRSRIVGDSPWYTLNECPDNIFNEADKLDKGSFPRFLTENWTNGQFIRALKTFKENHIVFLNHSGERVLAAGFSAPIHLSEGLPKNGWEGTISQIISDYEEKRKPNALVAFSVSTSQDARGQRMGDKLLSAFKQRAKELGLSKLIVPARPTAKSRYPDISMEDYINLYDKKTGEHVDPWIRAHQRNGGKVVDIGRDSHVVRTSNGDWPSTEQWEEWTGMKFTENGNYNIPRGNAKLHIRNGIGEYREDCIWIEYDIEN